MSYNTTWREYLKEILKDRNTREKIARELHVNSATLTRWTRDERPTEPLYNNLKPLLESQLLTDTQWGELFGLLQQDYPDLEPPGQPALRPIAKIYEEVVPSFYKLIVEARITTTSDRLFETITKLVIQSLKEHITPLYTTVLLFTPPQQDTPIRSLYHPLRPPMNRPASIPQMFPVYCGLEIFSPFSAALHIEPHVLSEQEVEAALKEQNFSAAMMSELPDIRSAMVIPLTQRREHGGYLIITSERDDFFDELHVKLCTDYANLLALGLADDNFYDASQVSLCFMPSLAEQIQKESVHSFTQRMKKIQAQYIKDHLPLRPGELEKTAIQQLEDELIQELYA